MAIRRELTEFMLSPARTPSRHSLSGRTVLDRAVVHIPDIQADREYTWAGPQKFGEYRDHAWRPADARGNRRSACWR